MAKWGTKFSFLQSYKCNYSGPTIRSVVSGVDEVKYQDSNDSYMYISALSPLLLNLPFEAENCK